MNHGMLPTLEAEEAMIDAVMLDSRRPGGD